jgi:hypothetical protein
MGGRRHRSRVEPTDESRRKQLALPCKWPEQLAYEEIQPLSLFGNSVSEWARELASTSAPFNAGFRQSRGPEVAS